jgi:hypothetical protein
MIDHFDGLLIEIEQVLDQSFVRSTLLGGQYLVEAIEFALIVHESRGGRGCGDFFLMGIGKRDRSCGIGIPRHPCKCRLRHLASCDHHKHHQEEETDAYVSPHMLAIPLFPN